MAKNLGKFGLPGRGGKGSSIFQGIKNNIGKIGIGGIAGTALWKGKGIVNLAKSVLGMKVAPKVASVASQMGATAATSAASKSSAKIVASQVAKEGVEAAAKSQTKTVAKVAGKSVLKSVIKKIPLIGFVAGLGFGLHKLAKGDFTGAAMEVASGAMSIVPGIGTAGSVAMDVAIAKKDIDDAKAVAGRAGVGENHEQVSNLNPEDKEALVKTAEKSGIIDVGWGKGDIDDYDKLATLDNNTLKAMLDVETWKEGDETLIRNLINARTKGPNAITPIVDKLISEESGILGSSVDATKRMLIPNMMIGIKEDEKQTLNDTLLKLVELNETIQAIKGDGAAAGTIVNNIYTDNSQGDTITDASSRSTQGGVGSVAVPHPAHPAIGSSSAVGLVPTTSTAY